MTLTEEQRRAVDAGPMVCVIAIAGAGKTRVLIERIKKLIADGASPEAVTAITYTVKAAGEITERLKHEGIKIGHCGTVHSWCLKLINAVTGPYSVCPQELFERMVKKGLEEAGCKESFDMAMKRQDDWKYPVVGNVIRKVRLELEMSGLIDYERILTLASSSTCMAAHPELDEIHLLVDEMQDTGPMERVLYERLTPKSMMIVGDDNQCHPNGTMIRIWKGSEVAIESLKNGDVVSAWSVNCKKFIGRPIKIASREYSGDMVSVHCSGLSVDATPDHRFMIRWANRRTMDCVTYLMYRKGFGYRVGWCQLFSHASKFSTFHLGHRARMEDADKTWVLKVFSDRYSASQYESIIAAKYGIPTIMFNPCHHGNYYDEKFIREVFAAVQPELDLRGERCLSDHGRSFEHHFYPWPGMTKSSIQGRRTICEVHASNLLPQHMKVVVSGTGEWAPIDRVGRHFYLGKVYSMNVEKEHTYSANGLVVKNCLYQFRGAEPGSMDRMATAKNMERVELTRNFRCSDKIQVAAAMALEGCQQPDARDINHIADIIILDPPDAVLCGTNSTVDQLTELLTKRGLKVTGKSRITDEQKRLEAYIRWRIDPKNGKLFEHMLSLVDPQMLEFLRRLAAEALCEILDVAEPGIPRYCSGEEWRLNELRKVMPDASMHELAELVIEQPAEADGLLICTIHASKGREWNSIVFVDDCGKSDHHKRMRYVAMTRARSKLTTVKLKGEFQR
jgi:hypothetical protein